jgi:hypothetical protein
VRDRIAAFLSEWMGLITSSLGAAQRQGDLDRDESIEQIAFELNAMLAQANAVFLLYGDHKAFDLARSAIRDRLERAGLV